MHEAGRLVLLAAVALLSAGSWKEASAQQPNIVGTWEWTRKNNNCSEQYYFREDGTLSIKSGDKQTQANYLMSWTPEPNGRYKLTIVTVKDHGGRDCAGSTEDTTGRRSTVYLLFGQSREAMIQCDSPESANCTGLMRKTAR
jgi:hypothetical protein